MNQNDIYDTFDEGGVLSKNFAAYEYREGQMLMADLVRQAYETHAIAAIEAGTGIGKSFAYLVPALFHAMEEPEDRTVIATATINLQKQLFEKDIPQLFKALGKKCQVALVVGRGNYLCLHRLEELVSSSSLLAQDPASEIGRLVSWARNTESGLRSDIEWRLTGELWQDVCCDADFCLGYKCPYIKECFLMKARKRASDARILVSNHHLLFSDARMRLDDDMDFDEEAILPPYHCLVIDEAHNIEKNATDFFTGTYSGREMLRQISYLSRRQRGANRNLIEEIAPYSLEPGLVDAILDQLSLLVEKVGDLDTFLLAWMQSKLSTSILIKTEHQRLLGDFCRLAKETEAAAGRLCASCVRLLEHNSAPDEFEGRLHELSVHAHRIDAAAEVLRQFIDFSAWGDDVHWFNVETYGKGHQKVVEVLISPLSIAPKLRQSLFEKLQTVVCTSATLDLNDDFQYWSSRVGLPLQSDRSYLKATFLSPFDYKHRLLLLTPQDAPVFTEAQSDAFVSYASDVVGRSILSAGGGSLVLFTSYQMMKVVRDLAAPMLERQGLTLLTQGEADRFQLLSRFKEDTDSVLFATDSFWEGIDAPGNTLRMVIIVKLPFRVPTDPVFKARQELLDAQGGSGFFHLALPEATMKLKQGFGRLMRSTMDTGVVLILDSRVVRKGYGIYMLNALPESYHPETTTEAITDKIEAFLYN
ncbi:MAG: ATP-dependent DNA helicase [Sphaerochaetaceae bacterium]